jgi:glycosyltransferase involved in cell wall biosynthesis
MHHTSGERIGIFIYEYGLGNSPSLINAGSSLAATGFRVDYFTFRTFIGGFTAANPNISIYRLDEQDLPDVNGRENDRARYVRGLLPLPIVKALGSILSHLRHVGKQIIDAMAHKKRLLEVEKAFLDGVNRYVNKAESIIGQNRYRCFIGVEPGGLMGAAIIGRKLGVPVIYYNLELHLLCEMKTAMDNVIKKYEKKYHPYAAFTITLDDERAGLLARDNAISPTSMLTVPVCAEGPKFEGKSDYLRKKYHLSEGTRIMLYAGFICEWAMCEELAIAAESWSDNTVLILHSHGYNDEGYLQKIKKYEGKKVRISLEAVPYDDLQSFLSSADVGIALYRDLGKNFTLVSSASGKLSHYLKSGLPVITNDYPGMKRIIDTYGCGACVESPLQINEVMERIFGNYTLMHQNAFRCYEDNYMFSKQFAKVIERIGRL